MSGITAHRRALVCSGLGVAIALGIQGCTFGGMGATSSPVAVPSATPTVSGTSVTPDPSTPPSAAPTIEPPSSTVRPSDASPGTSRGSATSAPAPAAARAPLDLAKDFVRRIPVDIRRGGCEPAVTVTTPVVPYVTCEQPSSGRSVIFRIYPDAATMNANFDENLYDNVPTDTSDCSTPRHTSTYRSGSHRGRMQCAIETTGGSGVILSTDESTFVVTNVTPGETGKSRYQDGYRLWRAALEVLPS